MTDLWSYRSKAPSPAALLRATQTERECDVCTQIISTSEFYYFNHRICKACIKAERVEYRKNLSPYDISEYNRGRRVKYKQKKKKPIAVKSKDYIATAKRRFKIKRIAKILEMYANGASLIEIGKELNITSGAASFTLTKHFFPYKGDDPVLISLPSKV